MSRIHGAITLIGLIIVISCLSQTAQASTAAFGQLSGGKPHWVCSVWIRLVCVRPRGCTANTLQRHRTYKFCSAITNMIRAQTSEIKNVNVAMQKSEAHWTEVATRCTSSMEPVAITEQQLQYKRRLRGRNSN